MPQVDVTFPSRTQVEVVRQNAPQIDFNLPDRDVIAIAIEAALSAKDLNSPRLQEIIDGFLAANPGDVIQKRADSAGLEYIANPGAVAPDYERTFAQTDLSIAGILPVNHGLGAKPSAVFVYDASGTRIQPDGIDAPNANAIALNLNSFVPLIGVWSLSIAR